MNIRSGEQEKDKEKEMDFKDIKVETFKDFTEYFTKTANREGNLARAEIYGYGDGVMIAIGAVLTGGNIKIGKNSFIGLYTYVNGKVNIGENVLIGPRCSIAAGNHKYNAKTAYKARTLSIFCDQLFSWPLH